MKTASTKRLLFGIVILLFAICLAVTSSASQTITFAIACVGLAVGAWGFFLS